MLAKINWTFFVKPESFNESMQNLISCIQNDLKTSDVNHNNASAGVTSDSKTDVTNDDVDDFAEDDFGGRIEHQTHAPMGLYGLILVKFQLNFPTYIMHFLKKKQQLCSVFLAHIRDVIV